VLSGWEVRRSNTGEVPAIERRVTVGTAKGRALRRIRGQHPVPGHAPEVRDGATDRRPPPRHEISEHGASSSA